MRHRPRLVGPSMIQKELTEYQSDGHRCPKCDANFSSEHGLKIHYGCVHNGSLATSWVCDWCGSKFQRPDSEVTGDSVFCSVECMGEYQEETRGGESHPQYISEKPIIECEQCGDEFEVQPARKHRKYCSKKCHNLSLAEEEQGQASHFWKGGKETSECEYCGDTIRRHPSQMRERSFCDRECFSLWRSENWNGRDHHNWRGGKSVYDAVKKLLTSQSWNSVAGQYREHVDGCCEMCGDSVDEASGGDQLDVHHIIPIMAGGTNGIWNLMALCRSCHVKVEAYTRDYAPAILTE